MANEKMMILKMLEEGKITAEEASRLMDASGAGAPAAGSMPQSSMSGYTPPTPPAGSGTSGGPVPNTRPGSTGPTGRPARPYGDGATPPGGSYTYGRQQQPPSGQSFEEFTSELGKKFDTFARDMEPKLQKFTENIVEKTASLADSISKSLSQPPAGTTHYSAPSGQPPYGGARPPGAPFSSGVMEKNFEMLVTPGYCELNLTGLNGDVVVGGYNGDKITAKVSYKPKFNAAVIELMKLGDKYYLSYDEDDFEFVTVDAYVPEKMFKNIRVETVNGKISMTTITTDFLTVLGINAKSELKYIEAGNLAMDTSNGEAVLFNVYGQNGKIDTFNGAVNATSLDVENLSLSSNNAPVMLNIDYFNRYNDYTWIIEASNGKLVMNIPSSPELGYYVKARTSLNNVKLGLTGMNYLVNTPSFVEAKSHSLDTAPKKIKLSAETSNAPLSIN